MRYLKGRLLLDMLSLFPFNAFVDFQNEYNKLLYLFKVLRLIKGFEILNVGDIM